MPDLEEWLGCISDVCISERRRREICILGYIAL